MSYPLQAGEEEHVCEFIQLPQNADGEIYVSGRAHDYNKGSHHYGLYRTTLDKLPPGIELEKPVDCWSAQNPLQYTTDFIVLEQTAHVDIDFPDGVALPFKSGEILLLQLHALNAQQVPADATVDVTLKTVPKSKVQQKMGLLQFYDPYIYLPPKSQAKASLRCELPEALTMIEANPHFHLRGIDHKTFIDPPTGPRSTQPLMDSTAWDSPPQWRGTMQLEAGSHVRLNCTYDNQDDRVYIQGQDKFENEMCSFWAYVYPVPEDRTIRDCVGTHVSEYGVGTRSCAETTACVQACPAGEAPDASVPGKFNVGPCWQKCIVDSCPNAGALFDAQSACAQTKCQGQCPGAGCDSCMAAQCAAEVSACQTTACN